MQDEETRTTQPPNGTTLDEPVSTTIMRDVRGIARKLYLVLLPKKDAAQQQELRNWDLWGPLLLCLLLAVVLGLEATSGQTAMVFAGVFVIVWLGSAIVTVNAQLLGGNLSFFQTVCVLGYCIFPLDIAAMVCLFVPWMLVRGAVVLAALVWASYASVGFLSGLVPSNRQSLAVYPIVLFYLFIGWMIIF